MSAEYSSTDGQIKAAYKSATQVETNARQLEARIGQIEVGKQLLPSRIYGQPVDLKKIRPNLTLTSLMCKIPRS